MSRTEQHQGTLNKVKFEGQKTIEEQLDYLVNTIGHDMEGFDSELKYWNSDCEDIFYINGAFYNIEDEEYEDSDWLAIASRTNEDTIQYNLRFYNGGCGFGECLEEALKGLGEID